MKYKVLITDMDGTLLDEKVQITEKTKKALNLAYERGVKIIFATGRLYSSAYKYAEEFDFPIPIISSNGAVIIDGDGEKIYENTLEGKKVVEAVKIMEKAGLYHHLYTEDTVYGREIDIPFLKRYYSDRKGNLAVKTVEYRDIEEVLSEGIKFSKILASSQNYSELDILEEELKEISNIELTKSWIDNVEVMNKGVSKGKAIEQYCKIKGISLEEIIAIGDNENDIPMIQYAGLGVAMGNAVDSVKEVADVITETNGREGIVKVVNDYILG